VARKGAAARAKTPAPAAPLDLSGLKQELKNTKAIGVFSKLTLKNQMDDLLSALRKFHQGKGKDTLTDESKQLVETSLAEIGKRPVPDVLVVGHTDLVGSHTTNDALSRQRAELIRSELIRLGVAAQNIEVVARGKRDPIVLTADGVAEPRNRRVEVVVR